MVLTKPSKATVFFWTADVRVTDSTKIVLIMTSRPADRGKSRPVGQVLG
jgi:hypothetical protein